MLGFFIPDDDWHDGGRRRHHAQPRLLPVCNRTHVTNKKPSTAKEYRLS
jgi:hypothetical protein